MKVAKIELLVLLAHITSCLTSHQASSWTENTPDVSGDKLNLGFTQLETYAFSMGVILPQGGKIWQNKRERETAIHYCIINSVILGVMHKFLSDINLYCFYVQILHKQMGYILYIQYYSSLCFPSQPLGYYKKTEQKNDKHWWGCGGRGKTPAHDWWECQRVKGWLLWKNSKEVS